jgi:hypothetical protein
MQGVTHQLSFSRHETGNACLLASAFRRFEGQFRESEHNHAEMLRLDFLEFARGHLVGSQSPNQVNGG